MADGCAVILPQAESKWHDGGIFSPFEAEWDRAHTPNPYVGALFIDLQNELKMNLLCADEGFVFSVE